MTQTILSRENLTEFADLLRFHYNLGSSGTVVSYVEGDFEQKHLPSQAEITAFRIKVGTNGAEVERAKGVAEANKIIGSSLKGNESYLRYLWIQGLQDGSSEVIYIATEAGLPILEASRFNKTVESPPKKGE